MEKSNHASVNQSIAMHKWSSVSFPVQWFVVAEMTCPFEKDQNGVWFKKCFPHFAQLWSSKWLSSANNAVIRTENCKLWTDVPVSRRCQSVQLSFIMCMPSVSGEQPLGMGFGPNLGWELGFGIPPFRTVLSYISTWTVVQIVQLLNNSDTLFNVLLTEELNFL